MSDLTLRYGEQRTLDVAVTDEDNAVQNITNSTFWFTVKADWLDADDDALLTLTNDAGGSGVSITDAPNGAATVNVVPGSFASIDNEPLRLVYGLVEKDSGDRTWRLDQGTLLVTPVVKETVS